MYTTKLISSSLWFPSAGILALYLHVLAGISVLKNWVLETMAREFCPTTWMCLKPQHCMLREVERVTYLYFLGCPWNHFSPIFSLALSWRFFPVLEELPCLLWKLQNEKMITCHKMKLTDSKMKLSLENNSSEVSPFPPTPQPSITHRKICKQARCCLFPCSVRRGNSVEAAGEHPGLCKPESPGLQTQRLSALLSTALMQSLQAPRENPVCLQSSFPPQARM